MIFFKAFNLNYIKLVEIPSEIKLTRTLSRQTVFLFQEDLIST